MRFRLALLSAVPAAMLAWPAAAPAASLSLQPAIATPGAAVAVEGGGWRPRSTVTVRRRGGAVLARARTSFDGSFEAPLRVPRAFRARSHLLQARGPGRGESGRGLSVAATLRVVRATRDWAPKQLAVSNGVRITVSRTVAFPSAPVRVDASGLRPGHVVSARLRDGEAVRARAGRAGRASVLLRVPDSRLEESILAIRAGTVRRSEPFYVLPPQTTVPPLPQPLRPAPLLAAAGDIACPPGEPRTVVRCHHDATGQQLAGAAPDAVAMLGDAQYEDGTLEEFAAYDSTWGGLKSRTRPAVGNHEYNTPGALPYFQYFGAAAGAPDRGYYSYDLGAWHVIVLNSNCSRVPCIADGPQERWLRADLAAHPDRCTLAYWHHPRHSSAQRRRDNTSVQPFWAALVEGGAEVALTAHVHNYERLAPLDAEGAIDRARGVRQFVVGTGGRNYQRLVSLKPYSESANTDTFGVLYITLRNGSYDWRFAPEPGDNFTDAGSANCH